MWYSPKHLFSCSPLGSSHIPHSLDGFVIKLGPAACHLQNQYSQMLVERKDAFNQNAGNLGRWWTQRPHKTTSQDSAQPWKLLKGNREVISVNHWNRGSELSPLPTACRLCAGLLTPCDLSLDALLFTSLFMRLLKGKLGKRSGLLLITYSSFLLLWYMERTNKLDKIMCDQKIWKVC